VKRVLTRNSDVVWRDEPAAKEEILAALGAGEEASDRGWVILVERGQMHELNLIAGEIWCRADGTRDAAEIAEELAVLYDAPCEEILADVEAFVAECAPRGWLRVEER